jgi:hypothetical protein
MPHVRHQVLTAFHSSNPATSSVGRAHQHIVLADFDCSDRLDRDPTVEPLHSASVGRYRLDAGTNLVACKFVTQVLRRTANIVIGIITAVTALLTFEGGFRNTAPVFASPALLDWSLGFQRQCYNPIAGPQIAITQPIKLEDVVIVEDEWG